MEERIFSGVTVTSEVLPVNTSSCLQLIAIQARSQSLCQAPLKISWFSELLSISSSNLLHASLLFLLMLSPFSSFCE